MDLVRAVVLLSPCFLVTALLAFLAFIRYITYRERVLLAQLGMTPPEESFLERLEHRTPRGVLWAGLITAMVGLALLLGLATLGTGPWLLGGLLPLFVGLGMVLLYFLGGGRRKKSPPAEEMAMEQDR
ncbi:MAG: DUF6249 domain-containing protein [Chloroflexia bacterium]